MANDSLPVRKQHRASWHDYSGGCYFVTVCTKEKEMSLGDIASNGEMQLSLAGKSVQRAIEDTPTHYRDSKILAYVIMPNHIHAIINITNQASEDMSVRKFGGRITRLGNIVSSIKGAATRESKQNGTTINWQNGYYDTIIKNDIQLQTFMEYIDANIARWAQDDYYFIKRTNSTLYKSK